ncbi:MAG: transcriptional repressor NrdR [Verrucomicrobia bacterium]|nr:transcriptional repressor NrdR [Verrucomicrobiota bacterium]
MRCPKCSCSDDKVIDSRTSREGAAIRRRRECLGCHFRFTTYEQVEQPKLMVVKRDGRREEFSREKLLAGIRRACQKRPVSEEALEDIVERVIADLSGAVDGEVSCQEIGSRVMDNLRQVDPIAYVRYASPSIQAS